MTFISTRLWIRLRLSLSYQDIVNFTRRKSSLHIYPLFMPVEQCNFLSKVFNVPTLCPPENMENIDKTLMIKVTGPPPKTLNMSAKQEVTSKITETKDEEKSEKKTMPLRVKKKTVLPKCLLQFVTDTTKKDELSNENKKCNPSEHHETFVAFRNEEKNDVDKESVKNPNRDKGQVLSGVGQDETQSASNQIMV